MTEAQLTDVLRDKWDPLGLGEDGPRDEYEEYASTVYEILRDGAAADKTQDQIQYRLATYLQYVRTQQMGLPPNFVADVLAATIIYSVGYD